MIVTHATWRTWPCSDQRRLGRLFSHSQALGLYGLAYLVERFRGYYRQSPEDVVIYLNWQVVPVVQR